MENTEILTWLPETKFTYHDIWYVTELVKGERFWATRDEWGTYDGEKPIKDKNPLFDPTMKPIQKNLRDLTAQGIIYGGGLKGELYDTQEKQFKAYCLYLNEGEKRLNPGVAYEIMCNNRIPTAPIFKLHYKINDICDTIAQTPEFSIINPKQKCKGLVYTDFKMSGYFVIRV